MYKVLKSQGLIKATELQAERIHLVMSNIQGLDLFVVHPGEIDSKTNEIFQKVQNLGLNLTINAKERRTNDLKLLYDIPTLINFIKETDLSYHIP